MGQNWRTVSRVHTLSRTRTILSATLGLTLAATLVPAVVAGVGVTPASARSTVQPDARHITYVQWTANPQFRTGTFQGTEAVGGALRIGTPVARRRYADPHGRPTRTYDLGRWISPWRTPGYAFEELVASWDASTPRDSWVQVQVRGRSESGKLSRWYTMANWAAGDATFHRTSVEGQSDGLAYVDVDTLKTKFSMGFTTWRMRVTLLRRSGGSYSPSVDMVGAMTSLLPDVATVRTSRPGAASGLPPLKVPRYSQMVHRGHYPEYGNGGEAWCSPTSVSMVLGYYRRLPPPTDSAWVGDGHTQPWVDHAARSTYDYAYRGAGNWSFGTAYAATHADAAFVTRFRNLREVERFVAAGIPVVVSIRFTAGELDRAPIRSSNGHLLVVVGFTASGDVIVNDPAAATSRGVRRRYDRGQFEDVWIPESGGLGYVIRDAAHPLPKGRAPNW